VLLPVQKAAEKYRLFKLRMPLTIWLYYGDSFFSFVTFSGKMRRAKG
jgi:hypothetical protein